MTTKQLKRVPACAGIAALFLSLFGQSTLANGHNGHNGHDWKTRIVDCAVPGASIQKEVDKVKHGRPTTIVVDGTCTEDVTVTRDDVTIKGADGGGTVDGTFTVVGARRVTFKELTITGSGHAIVATDNASLTVRDNPYAALSIGNSSTYRSGSWVNSETQPDNAFPFEQIMTAPDPDAVAIELYRQSFLDLRQVHVEGYVWVGDSSTLQIRGDNVGPHTKCSTLNGFLDVAGIFAVARLRTTNVSGGVYVGRDARLNGSTTCL